MNIRTLSLGLVATTMAWLTNASPSYQDTDTHYLAFEAEDYHNIIRHNGDNDGFNVVSIDEFTSEFGTSVLPANSAYPASENRALLADFRYEYDMNQSTVEYQVVFQTPGTYRLYYRRSMFEKDNGSSYGGEDSFFYANEFDGRDFVQHGSRQSQDSDGESNPQSNPSEGKFFWYRVNNDFTVTQQDVGKILTFSIRDREKGFALDRFIFSLDHDLDMEETPKDGDGNQLDELVNSPRQKPESVPHLFPMDYVPHFESDEEIHTREVKLKNIRNQYIAYLFEQDRLGHSQQLIDALIAKNNEQDDSKSALRTLIMLITDESFFPHWRGDTVSRFYAEGELARVEAERVIVESDGKVNDLKQVTPIRRYMDYAWGLYMLGAFHDNTEESIRFRTNSRASLLATSKGSIPTIRGRITPQVTIKKCLPWT